MIKGKFYTGLPEKMMNRSRGMDRQQTNFFWPDESEAEETPIRKVRPAKANASPMTSATVNNSTVANDEIKPKELFHKQLSSRIEFYDNVDAKTPEARRRRFKKIDNVNLNNLNNLNNADNQYVPEKKKLETFSSKIEFYDFVDATKPTELKRNNAAVIEPIKQKQKIEIDDEPIRKPIERTDSMKKRISFQVEKASPEKTKSILKNVDGKSQQEKNTVKPLPKRGLLPKSMSKSVDNMSKLSKSTEDVNEKNDAEPKSEKLISIIREVKNMNLTEQKPTVRSSVSRTRYVDDYDDDDDDYGYSRAGNRRTNHQRGNDFGRRISDDRRYIDRFDDRYDGEPVYGYNERPYYRRESQPRSNGIESYDDRRVRRSPERIDDDYYESQARRYASPAESQRTPLSRGYNDIDNRSPRQIRNVPIDVKPYAELDRPMYGHRTSIRTGYEDRPIERKPIDRGQRASSEQPINYSPADSGRAHRHLRSNIFFNDDVRQPSKRPLSVRDSAVTRVGVGLPDI